MIIVMIIITITAIIIAINVNNNNNSYMCPRTYAHMNASAPVALGA